MDDFIIHFQGFSPSPFSKNYLRDVLLKVHDEAPSTPARQVEDAEIFTPTIARLIFGLSEQATISEKR
jgi:hypothetical protein